MFVCFGCLVIWRFTGSISLFFFQYILGGVNFFFLQVGTPSRTVLNEFQCTVQRLTRFLSPTDPESAPEEGEIRNLK